MPATKGIALALVLLLFPASASAAFIPSFVQEWCTWHATHIVVVTEGDKIDGELKVLESWKGDLKKGERIVVPELAQFEAKDKRRVEPPFGGKPADLTPHVTCSRMVLFLIKSQAKSEPDKPAKTVWRPALPEGDMPASIAWVEKGRVFAHAQIENPGLRFLYSRNTTEERFRGEVETVLRTQVDLCKVLSQPDPARVTAGLVPFLKTRSHEVRWLIFRTTGKAGPVALPALRTVLNEEPDHQLFGLTLATMAEAGGSAVAHELTELLKAEVAYWYKVGPALKPGWWDVKNADWPQHERYALRTYRTSSVLSVLKQTRTLGSKETVIALQRYWKSLPQLAEITSILRDCEYALSEFDFERPTPSISP